MTSTQASPKSDLDGSPETWAGFLIAAVGAGAYVMWHEPVLIWWDEGGEALVKRVGVSLGVVLAVGAIWWLARTVRRFSRSKVTTRLNDGLKGAKVPCRVRGLKLDRGSGPVVVNLVHDNDVHLSDAQVRRAVKVVAERAGRGAGYEADYRPDERKPRLVVRRVRVPRPLPTMVPYPLDRTLDPLRIEYGVAEGDDIQTWDLTSDPHALVVGPTGAGKTGTMRALIMGIVRRRHEVWILDPKRIEFRDLEGWPKVRRFGDTSGDEGLIEMADAIEAAHKVMDDRYDLSVQEMEKLPKLFLVIDEGFNLYKRLNRWWKENRPKGVTGTVHPVITLLDDIGSKGRSAGVHLLFGIQRPDAKLMGDDGGFARDNFGHRVSLGRMSPNGARMLWGDGDDEWKPATRVQTTKPDGSTMKGRGVASGPAGPREVQVWWVDFGNAELMSKLHPYGELPPPPPQAYVPPTEDEGVQPEMPRREIEDRNVLAMNLIEDDVLLERVEGVLHQRRVLEISGDGELTILWVDEEAEEEGELVVDEMETLRVAA